MDGPEINKKLFFLGYDATLPQGCVKRLKKEWEKRMAPPCQVPDFSRFLILLPGSFAIREFRKELTLNFPTGCLPPKLLTPGSFRNLYGRFSQLPPVKCASKEEALFLWVKTLEEAPREEFPHLLAGMEKASWKEYLSLAKKIQDFRGELDQGGLTLEEVLSLAPQVDTERRLELSALEKKYLLLASSHSLQDPFRERFLAKLALEEVLDSIPEEDLPEKIIVAGIPDLAGGCKELLALWGRRTALEIWVLASPEESLLTDPWGIPLPQAWEKRPLPIEEEQFPQTVFHGGSVREMIHLACAVGGRHGEISPVKSQYISAGRELTPALTEKLREMTGGANIYDPAGIPLRSLRICRFLSRFLELCREENDFWMEFLLFLRTREILQLGKRVSGTPENTLLKELDELLLEHLPDSLENALFFASPSWQAVFRKIQEKLEAFQKAPARALVQLLAEIFRDENAFPPVEGVPLKDEYTAFLPLLKEMQDSLLLSTLNGESFLELLLGKASSIALYPPHTEKSLEVLGFLEIPSLSQEELLICGMNDGYIPEKMDLSLFLTDAQREALKLPCNRTRRTRDGFYLNFALRFRKQNGGSIRFFASRYSINGTPVRFSPFLFQGRDDKTLLALTDLLFSPGYSVEKSNQKTSAKEEKMPGLLLPVPPYTPGKSGAPGITTGHDGKKITHPLVLSVTEIKAFLASPLRFCLGKFYNMEQYDYSIREMDALHYGTVCHKVLEYLSCHEDKKEEELRKMAAGYLDRILAKEYGTPLPLLVETQHDLILQRLEAACRIFCENAASFRILEREYTLGGDPQKGGLGYIPWQEARLKGRIDRIEISKDGKILRLLDYKTMDKGDSPANTHYQKRKKTFKDLQLPLYKILLMEDPFFRELHKELDWENITIFCGYFCLPKNVSDTGIKIWKEMDELLPQAKTTLAGVIYEIRENMARGIFLEDPEKKIRYDSFGTLFLPDAASAVKGCRFTMDEEV